MLIEIAYSYDNLFLHFLSNNWLGCHGSYLYFLSFEINIFFNMHIALIQIYVCKVEFNQPCVGFIP